MYSFKTDDVIEADELPTDTIAEEKPEKVLEYGLETDSFLIYKDIIKPNEFLANILLRYNVSYATIDELARRSKKVYDVRKLARGKEYTVFCTKDSSEKAQCFVYQPNAIDYVVYDLRDSIRIYKGKKQVDKKIKTLSGVITSSLYETLQDRKANPMIAMELADIYAWSIDFYRIQKGDWFKVIYEELYVDEQIIGIGEMKAALFSHMDEEFYAFKFVQDSIGDYFDEEANSLRKAFLKAPVKYSRISSRYTRKRFHPVQKRYKAHLGTDYAAAYGTPIRATGSGKIIASRYSKYNGNFVKIKHNSTYTTQYLHMSKRAVRRGEYVKQGDVIGYVGSTGLATGPHVCYRFWKYGKQVDHLREKFPPSKPVKEENMEEFKNLMEQYKQDLDSLQLPSVSEPV